MKKALAVMKIMFSLILIIFVLTGCSNNSSVQKNDPNPDPASHAASKSDPAPNTASEPVTAPKAASDPASGEKAKKDTQETKLSLTSEKYGFTMEAPAFWKGKAEVSEEKDSFMVRHVTVSKKAPVQNLVIINVIHTEA